MRVEAVIRAWSKPLPVPRPERPRPRPASDRAYAAAAQGNLKGHLLDRYV